MKTVVCLISMALLSSCVMKGTYDPTSQKFDFSGSIIITPVEDYKK